MWVYVDPRYLAQILQRTGCHDTYPCCAMVQKCFSRIEGHGQPPAHEEGFIYYCEESLLVDDPSPFIPFFVDYMSHMEYNEICIYLYIHIMYAVSIYIYIYIHKYIYLYIYICIPRSSTYALFLPLMVLPWISNLQNEFCLFINFCPWQFLIGVRSGGITFRLCKWTTE